ncbi:MAG: tetratricopeptide repeat protein, partial [Propionivibrio sp.]|nr:tetratricopeptide repeat protein [Propionivibrio sp.]
VAIVRAEEARTIYQSIASTQAVPWARMGYAMMLQREKKYDEARDEADQLNQEHPEFLSVYDLLAQIHENAGEYRQAIECLERASSITSSTNTDRLRKIADVAEVAGDRDKVISTLRRVVERTQRSSMLNVDDYLSLTRTLLDEKRVDEAAAIADEMRLETRKIASGELALEVATAMVHRGKGQMTEARSSLDKAFDLLDADQSATTDTLAAEIAEEAVQHGEVGRAAALIARLSTRDSLPGKIKARVTSWLEGERADNDDAGGEKQKAAFGEQIMISMIESLEQLDANWSEERATKTREILIDAFTLMPRDKRVINAHIRYNSVAVRNGGERHSPTTRTDH